MAIYQKKTSSSVAVISGFFIILLVCAIVSYAIYAVLMNDPIDKETLCPSSGPKGQYVVLIDNTSPFPYTQKVALAQRLKNIIKDDLPEGYMLSIFLLGEDAAKNDEPLFERCSPGQWGDKSQLSSNKKFIERDFREKFSKPLDKVVSQISLHEDAKKSPIFEMLQLAGINGFERVDVKGERKLIIYSDMLANTSDFSMYRLNIPTYEDFSKTIYARRALAPALHDVSVSMNIISGSEKNQKTQSTKLISFWEHYFEASGATVESVDFIEGL